MLQFFEVIVCIVVVFFLVLIGTLIVLNIQRRWNRRKSYFETVSKTSVSKDPEHIRAVIVYWEDVISKNMKSFLESRAFDLESKAEEKENKNASHSLDRN